MVLGKTLLLSAVLSIVSILPLTSATGAKYTVKDTYTGTKFLDEFTFETIADPTHGRVDYVDKSYAVAHRLAYARGSVFYMHADATTKLSASGPGRKSVRIRSQASFTTHVAVFNIAHMPEGCGTWPAAWETSESGWPNYGEVDVIEGANNVSPNLNSLHTSANCKMPSSGRAMTGTATSNDCDVYDNGNAGCGVKTNKAHSFGPSFNANGGGWYAMERTSSHIRVFFWPRNDSAVPSDVKTGASSINTARWGTPVALFPNSASCDIASHFGPNNIIFDLTFCGDWAGVPSVFKGAGCAGSCVNYVNDNPSAFAKAYWQINSLRVYT